MTSWGTPVRIPHGLVNYALPAFSLRSEYLLLEFTCFLPVIGHGDLIMGEWGRLWGGLHRFT